MCGGVGCVTPCIVLPLLLLLLLLLREDVYLAPLIDDSSIG